MTGKHVDFVVYSDLVAAKKPRKCPRCGVRHYWPTEDKLCYRCEGEWVREFEWGSARGMRFLGEQ